MYACQLYGQVAFCRGCECRLASFMTAQYTVYAALHLQVETAIYSSGIETYLK